jgi:hypothetical protein
LSVVPINVKTKKDLLFFSFLVVEVWRVLFVRCCLLFYDDGDGDGDAAMLLNLWTTVSAPVTVRVQFKIFARAFCLPFRPTRSSWRVPCQVFLNTFC